MHRIQKLFQPFGLFLLLPAFLLAEFAGGSTAEPVVVHAGRILDVESGEVRQNVLITVEGGVIREIRSAEGLPPLREWIDLSRYTVLPGLIDTHTHLCDNTYMGEDFDHWELSAASFGIAGVVNARKTLHAGFTTVRNVSEPYFAGVALRDAIAAAWVEGPRMYVSGPMLSMTGGHGDWGTWMAPEHKVETPAEVVADGVDAVRKAVREHIRHGVDLIKLSATGGFSSSGTIPGAATYTVEEMRAAVEEAAKRGLKVAAHAHGEAGIRNALAAGVHSIEHAALMEEGSLQEMQAKGVFLVMDLLAAHYDLVETRQDFADKDLPSTGTDFYREYAARFTRAYRAGVPMAFGTDSGVYPHGRNAEQLALMVEAGMTPLDAIRSATLWAAELIGIEGKAGNLRPGMWADLIAVKGDPLSDISTLTDVHFVMKGGQVVASRP